LPHVYVILSGEFVRDPDAKGYSFSYFPQGVVYQLDAALESAETQKHGLVFIYDMSDSKYQNFDYDLSQKILTLLKVSRRDTILDIISNIAE